MASAQRGGIERLTGWLDSHPGARLVIIDVYPRVRPDAGSSARDRFQTDYAAAALLQAVAVTYGVAIVCLYHTRKAEASDFVETVQGTFGTAAAADTIVVVKRARGQADATLHVTGRDVLEQELALRFAPEAGTWELLGDAAEHALGETRKEILDAVRAHGRLTPKQVSDLTSIPYDLAKKTMQRMFRDGQLDADGGRYSDTSPKAPVPGVPLSPEDGVSGTRGASVVPEPSPSNPAQQQGFDALGDSGDTGDSTTEGLVGRSVRCSKHDSITSITKVSHSLAYFACGCHVEAA
jgi:hypothetical protein